MRARDDSPIRDTFFVMFAFMLPTFLFIDCKGAGGVVPTILENVPGSAICELIPLPQNQGVICADLVDIAQGAIAALDDAGAFSDMNREPCRLVPLSRGNVYFAGSVCESIAGPIQSEIDAAPAP